MSPAPKNISKAMMAVEVMKNCPLGMTHTLSKSDISLLTIDNLKEMEKFGVHWTVYGNVIYGAYGSKLFRFFHHPDDTIEFNP